MVTAYPVAGKQKAHDICRAFVDGCGGQMGSAYRGGPAFFYGVNASNQDIWEKVLANGDPYFYCDNSFFDSRREISYRVAKGALQHDGRGTSDGSRFAALGIEIKPWREAGEHFVVCPQSDHFMKVLVGRDGDWGKEILRHLEVNSKREIRYRDWNPNKKVLSSTLGQDLVGAHALVTWSSAAAVTAILSGIPAIVHSNDCAARCMAGDPWDLEDLPKPDDRARWAGVLADNEWTLDEFRSGLTWRSLNA